MRLYVNGVVRTMDALAVAEAMAIDGDRIAGVGTAAAMRALAGPHAEAIDLGGKTIVPGFVDAHHHLSLAVLYEGAVDCRPTKVTSVSEIVEALRQASERIPAGEWVVGYGYDHWQLAEGRHPTRADLDAACPDHPATVVHYSFHSVVANSRALELAEIGRDTPDPAAGQIVRGRRGEPNGLLIETALSRVEELARKSIAARDGAGFIARLARYEERLFAVGITGVADPMVTPEVERLFREAKRCGSMRMPFVLMPIDEGGYLVPPTQRLDGPPTGEGNDELRIGPLKLVFDGGDACAMCLTAGQAMQASLMTIGQVIATRSLAPVRAAMRGGGLRLGSDLKMRSGLRFYPDDAAALALVERAVERGFTLAIHAMGNDAVDQAIRVLTAVRSRHRDSPPPRIEHATIVDDQLLARASEAGICLVVQPAFVELFEHGGLPPLPGMRVLAHRSMLSHKLSVAASSDAPVMGFAPLDGIRRAVDRGAIAPEEAISAEEALAMYTREAARACGLRDVGTLSAGMRADFVILSDDPCTATSGVSVDETVLGGTTVFERRAASR
jgi:predicted amidohydrolase YtcJ